MTTLPEEAVKAAIAAHNKYYDDLVIYPSEEPTPEGAFHAALKGALPFLPALEPSGNACPCTKVQQDETCPVGYPSLLCEICDGKGVVQPSAARELALEEVKTSGATDVRGLIKTYANAAFEQQGNDIPKYLWHLHFEEFAAAIRALSSPDHADADTLETYYARQIEWSKNTFGPALRTKGIIDHIKKELKEIEAEPHDLSEWIDVVILAMDGFWRHGGSVDDLMTRLLAKQKKNMARTWPDWRTMSEDQAIEHDRSRDADHADAGKVEGDGRADLERFWRPISEADKSITFEDTFDIGDGKSMTIRNSDHYWVRDADGRVYEATWSDHKGGYWWDLEGESPADPVEYMPHPLSLPSAPASEGAE